MIGLYIAIGVVVVLLIAYIGCVNNLRRTNVTIDESLSDIDVALEKRYDKLTKLIECVKGYSKHEADTLTKVIELRNKKFSSMSLEEKNNAEASFNEALRKVEVIKEAYPEIKANTTYVNLMNAISDCEEHLQASRRLYNANVRNLNQMIVSFPTSLVAKMSNVSKREFFEAESYKKEDVKISF